MLMKQRKKSIENFEKYRKLEKVSKTLKSIENFTSLKSELFFLASIMLHTKGDLFQKEERNFLALLHYPVDTKCSFNFFLVHNMSTVTRNCLRDMNLRFQDNTTQILLISF